MNGTSIGIKIADGSLYPVLEEDFKGQKRLILTTVRDNQKTVQIDLYRGEGEKAEKTGYIGSLIIENLKDAPKGEPEIEVVLGVDEEGNLTAEANDLFSGEKQSLSVSLESIPSGGFPEVPEFDIEEAGVPGGIEAPERLEDTLLTGETYPISPKDRRKEHLAKRKLKPLFLIGFVLLGLLLIAGIAFLIFNSMDGPSIPSLLSGKESPQGIAEVTAAPVEQPAVKEEEPAAGARESSTEEEAPAGVSYNIKRGDTLWDISSTFYRNPWLYPKIAKANGIINPDIIFAGQTIFIPQD